MVSGHIVIMTTCVPRLFRGSLVLKLLHVLLLCISPLPLRDPHARTSRTMPSTPNLEAHLYPLRGYPPIPQSSNFRYRHQPGPIAVQRQWTGLRTGPLLKFVPLRPRLYPRHKHKRRASHLLPSRKPRRRSQQPIPIAPAQIVVPLI